jgi:TRAP-type C4-dicarboxylate transport system permease small subunit
MSLIDLAVFIAVIVLLHFALRPVLALAAQHYHATGLPRGVYAVGAGLVGWGLAALLSQQLDWYATPLALLMSGGVYAIALMTNLSNVE